PVHEPGDPLALVDGALAARAAAAGDEAVDALQLVLAAQLAGVRRGERQRLGEDRADRAQGALGVGQACPTPRAPCARSARSSPRRWRSPRRTPASWAARTSWRASTASSPAAAARAASAPSTSARGSPGSWTG